MFRKNLATSLLHVSKSCIKSQSMKASFLLSRCNEVGEASSKSYQFNAIRTFAKAKKGGKVSKDDEEETVTVSLPSVKDLEKSSESTYQWLVGEFSKVKVGRASSEMFQTITLPRHGTVGKVAQVTLKSNTKLLISVYDPSIVNDVVDAIKNCGLNLNPSAEGSNIMVTVPRPTKEARDVLVKNCSKLAEKAKLDIRNHRKNILDQVKKIKGSVSEDDIRRHGKDVETSTEKMIEKVSQLLKSKEKEINTE